MTDTEVTIIGGGVHGTHLAIRLLNAGIVDRQRLRILDPNGLLANLRRQCQQCGMTELRSPFVHHISQDPFSLREFARERERTDELIPTKAGGDRPTVSLFFDHAEWICEKHDLGSLVELTRATAIADTGDHVEIDTQNGRHTTRWCLLAVGHRQLNRLRGQRSCLRQLLSTTSGANRSIQTKSLQRPQSGSSAAGSPQPSKLMLYLRCVFSTASETYHRLRVSTRPNFSIIPVYFLLKMG